MKIFKNILKYQINGKDAVYWTLSPVEATFLIAECFKREPKKAELFERVVERLALNLSTFPTSAIIKHNCFANTCVLPPASSDSKPVLLLWARYTGSNSPEGYNPEGDSDPHRQGQLLALAREDFEVIRIGHDPATERNEKGVHSSYHLGEFYTKEPIKDKGRGAQLSFFLAMLERYPGKVYQMGQKTGGIDAAALVGMPTLYIEDEGSGTRTRMETWTKSVPFYRCALIKEPPTLLGKALRQLNSLLEKEPTFRKIEGKDIPSRKWRMIALLYFLKPDFTGLTEGEMNDASKIKNLVIGASKSTMNKWDVELTKDDTPRGYTSGNMAIIKQALENLKQDYRSDENAIVRNQNGKYVARNQLEVAEKTSKTEK